ncbi:MAG: hypothetical protein JWR44_3352, partial [Hymenobacter sp.]|nr:hypothetical protein [Hymenobacter sp.]
MSRYRFIAAERGHYPVRQLCQVLGVPASRFNAWHDGQQQAAENELPAWGTTLIKVFGVHKRHYGTRRLQVGLRQKGHRVGRSRLHALQPKAYTPRTTDSTLGLRCLPTGCWSSPNPPRPSAWVSDITCLPLANGSWAYLCAFQDACTKHVVGWHVAATMSEELVTAASQGAFLAQPPTPVLVVHCYRGSQYCGNAYRALLHDHRAIRSESRRGEC